MPSVLGSEMQIGFGPGETCPEGTDGAGANLADTNRERWTALAPVEELRARAEEAWQRAIDLHVETLSEVPSVVAYGGIFGDDLEAARRLAEENVTAHPELLWSMFTNLQPELGPDGVIVGPWSSWCPVCDGILTDALAAGGSVGLQLAATEGVDEGDELMYAIDEAVDRLRAPLPGGEPRDRRRLRGVSPDRAGGRAGPDPLQAPGNRRARQLTARYTPARRSER